MSFSDEKVNNLATRLIVLCKYFSQWDFDPTETTVESLTRDIKNHPEYVIEYLIDNIESELNLTDEEM